MNPLVWLLLALVVAAGIALALRKKPASSPDESQPAPPPSTPAPEEIAIPAATEFVPNRAKTRMGREGELTSCIAFLAVEHKAPPEALLALCRQKAQALRESITEVKDHKILITVQIFSEVWSERPTGERLFTYHWKGWESSPEEVSWPGRPPGPP